MHKMQTISTRIDTNEIQTKLIRTDSTQVSRGWTLSPSVLHSQKSLPSCLFLGLYLLCFFHLLAFPYASYFWLEHFGSYMSFIAFSFVNSDVVIVVFSVLYFLFSTPARLVLTIYCFPFVTFVVSFFPFFMYTLLLTFSHPKAPCL